MASENLVTVYGFCCADSFENVKASLIFNRVHKSFTLLYFYAKSKTRYAKFQSQCLYTGNFEKLKCMYIDLKFQTPEQYRISPAYLHSAKLYFPYSFGQKCYGSANCSMDF